MCRSVCKKTENSQDLKISKIVKTWETQKYLHAKITTFMEYFAQTLQTKNSFGAT